MKLDLRPFTEHDYNALAAVRNAVLPDYPLTVEALRRWDENRNPDHTLVRWIGEIEGQPIAFGTYMHQPWMFHPRKFETAVSVHPDYQRRGVGSRIYDHLLAELTPHDPLMLRVAIREDDERSMRFASDRNFREEMRSWESRLDVTTFDFAPYAGCEEYTRDQGIVIKTFGELDAVDPEHWHKMHAAMTTMEADVPAPEPITPTPFEDWERRIKGNPAFLPDGYFIALHNGHYVGMSELWHPVGWQDLDTGLTATRREHRRKGIALALKLRAIAYAREHGFATIRTDNELNNRGMLSINERLGFVKQPAWISLVNVLEEEE